MEKISFNLFKVNATADKPAPLFRKGRDGAPDTPAEYVGSTQDPTVTKIVAVKATSKAGQPYYRLLVIRKTGEQTVYHDGALFKNERKENQNQPDLTGSLDLDKDGNRLRLAAWMKTGEKAGPYLSVTGELPRKADASTASAASALAEEDFSVPF
jgi:uncharacterized protein (DUF736 family)